MQDGKHKQNAGLGGDSVYVHMREKVWMNHNKAGEQPQKSNIFSLKTKQKQKQTSLQLPETADITHYNLIFTTAMQQNPVQVLFSSVPVL